MEENFNNMVTPSDWVPTDSMIKVIGVGGGGCNAVTYMYNQQIEGCTFIVCNTDMQSLINSNVPQKIQLGTGRGAGTNPTKGMKAAIEAESEIEKAVLGPETEMLFITAGMGGGTGTGAAPVIASMAKKKGILTVAVVTLPFKNEGNESMSKAIAGIHELEKNVDSLLIINNEKLYEYYGDLLIQDAFPKADQVLATAVRGVVDIIKSKGFVNVDFEDVKAVMHDSGMALLGCGTGTGENRIEDAIKQALESPLLNDFDLTTAKNTLINITVGYNEHGLLAKELSSIDGFIGNRFKRGIVYNHDEDFGDKIEITVIATGFKMSALESMIPSNAGSMIVIGPDFRYNPEKETEELPETQPSIKIGPSTVYNVRKFNYSEADRPALAVQPGENLSELEHIPAIRRQMKHGNDSSEAN